MSSENTESSISSGSFVGNVKSESDEEFFEAATMCEEEYIKSESASTSHGTSSKSRKKRRRIITGSDSSSEENQGDDNETTIKINGSGFGSTTPTSGRKSSSKTKTRRLTFNDEDDDNEDKNKNGGNSSNVSEGDGDSVVDLVSSSGSSTEEEEAEDSENSENSSYDENEEESESSAEETGCFKKHLKGLPKDDYKPPDFGFVATNSKVAKKKSKKRKKKSDGKTRRVRKKVEVLKSKNRNSIDGDGNEMDDSEEYDDDDELFVGDSQEVSIHQILIKKVELSDEGKLKMVELKVKKLSIEDIIDVIIEAYNNKRKSQQYNEDIVDVGFTEKEITKFPKLRAKDAKYFSGEKFQIRIFTQEIRRQLVLMKSYGIKTISVVIHTLIFHYREDPKEIFALTTGGAWNVVQQYSDLSFPAKIAARILDEKGSLEETNKKIVGNSMTEKTTMKRAEKNNPFKMIQLCTGFKAKLRDSCSLFKLEAFRKNNTDQPNATIKMNVGLALVRILKRLTVCDFLTVLSLFSEISRGKRTFQYIPGEVHGEEEIDSDAHQKWLTLVPSELGGHLDLIFGRKFKEAVRNPEEAKRLSEQFQICHKHTSDYSNGHDFALWKKREVIKEFDDHPSIEEICEEIGLNVNIKDINSDDALLKTLDSISLAFKIEENSKENKREKLLKLIEGLLENPDDGRIYWKVMSRWCSIRDEYLVIVHSQFIHVLQEVLLLKDADFTNPNFLLELEFEWTNQDTRTKYIEKHENESDFIIWKDVKHDKVIEYGFFDMAKIIKIQSSKSDTQKLVLYFIASALDSQITKVCERIKTTSIGIRWANSYINNPTKLNSSYEELKKFFTLNKRKFRRNEIKDLESFLNLLSEATIVLAVAQSNNENCSLKRESELLTSLKPEDIENYLEKARNKVAYFKKMQTYFEDNDDGSDLDIFTNIANLLSQKEYLNYGSYNITNKLLICNKRNFKIFENQNKIMNLNTFIFEQIISKFKSGFNFLIPKLEVTALKKELGENPQNEFRIFEIPLELESEKNQKK